MESAWVSQKKGTPDTYSRRLETTRCSFPYLVLIRRVGLEGIVHSVYALMPNFLRHAKLRGLYIYIHHIHSFLRSIIGFYTFISSYRSSLVLLRAFPSSTFAHCTLWSSHCDYEVRSGHRAPSGFGCCFASAGSSSKLLQFRQRILDRSSRHQLLHPPVHHDARPAELTKPTQWQPRSLAW